MKQYHAFVMTIPVYVFFYHMDETRRVMHYKLGVVALYRSGPRRPCEVHPS